MEKLRRRRCRDGCHSVAFCHRLYDCVFCRETKEFTFLNSKEAVNVEKWMSEVKGSKCPVTHRLAELDIKFVDTGSSQL